MDVYHFGGKIECNSAEELDRALMIRYENNSNEYELHNQTYPMLSVLAKDQWACVHLFFSETDCGRYAYCDDTVLDKEGFMIFNSGSPISETEISNSLLIPLDLAIKLVRDFFKGSVMSTSAKWFEL